MRFAVFLVSFLTCPLLFAQNFHRYFELGLSGNYRKTYLTESGTIERAYDESSAYIASFAYYFREMTAIEFSYSQGNNTRFIPSESITSTTRHKYTLYGADLIFTFGSRGDQWIPYIKAGVAYFDRKSIEYSYVQTSTGTPIAAAPVELESTFVPSAGLGLQVRITNYLSFKFGIDVWTSGPVKKDLDEFDWAGRVGISWFL